MAKNNSEQHFCTDKKNIEKFNQKTIQILEMIAIGTETSKIYDAIALLFESRHGGLRCSMLELVDGKLMHGGAPSLPKAYCEAVNGLENGANVGSCGTSTYTGKRCIVENIETSPNWKDLKEHALPHGMRCCWSEPIVDSSGKILGAFGMYYDEPRKPNAAESEDLIAAARLAGLVMERDHNHKRIHQLAYFDSLTQLASRASLYQYIESLIKMCLKNDCEFSILYIDLDDFKQINDTQGHDAGDMLLKLIAKELKQTCSENFIARLSGDEFCVVSEHHTDISAISKLARQCCDAISKPKVIDDVGHNPTCSIGIAKFPEHGTEVSSLLKAADTALYASKELGKNCFAFYDPKLTKEMEYKIDFEKCIREAIEQKQMTLVYQPKIDILSNRLCGVEALARWFHPKFGQVSPDCFIGVIENIGMMSMFTEWVLLEGCHQVALWARSGHAVRMAVNVPPSLFLNREIINLVKRAINQTGINPSMLELEVTENVVQRDLNNLSVFEDLKDLGVRLAIDDFGTGYASFASLRHIKIDSLKIDKYFIVDILRDCQAQFLISSMIDIGHNFGYDIIAEGVEKKEQYEALKCLNCDMVQGFYFCKPVSAASILSLYSSFRLRD